jgi:hypothetical protein
MKKLALILLVVLAGCGTGRLDQGIIELNQRQSDFVRAWGLPDRQYTKTGDEITSAGWGGYGGSFFRGKRLFEIWVYESRKTELAFDNKKRLAGYKTDLSRQELQNTFVGDKP